MPAEVRLPAPARDLAAGDWSTCALLETGDVWCWGPMSGPDRRPRRILRAPDAVELGLASQHLCLLHGSGRVTCWVGPGGPARLVAHLTYVVDLGVGGDWGFHACALRSSGEVLCWGGDLYGELGDGMISAARDTPGPVLGLP